MAPAAVQPSDVTVSLEKTPEYAPPLPPGEDEDMFNERNLAWGWRGFKPDWLQWLNTPKWFVLFLGIFSFLQGMAVNTFISMSFPSLEKQYGLTSSETGFIASSNDITAIILVVFVSFFGSYGHKTKWLGGGALLTGVGALVFALPHLLSPKQDVTDEPGSLPFCMRNTTTNQEDGCHSAGQSSHLYYAIFIFSQLMSGAGTTPLHTLGPAYIDENVPPEMVAPYLAVFYMSVFLGPGFGSIIGGQLLNIFVDVSLPANSILTPSHPKWIGAWWLGPLSCGFLIIVCGLAISGFPSELPGSRAIRQKAKKSGHVRKQDSQLKGNLKDILPATKQLLTNGSYIFQVIGSTFSVLVAFGFGPFIFKIITGRYGATSLEAGVAIAMLLVPGGACGFGLGTFLVKKLGIRQSCRQAAKITFFLQLIGVWGSLCFMIPGCEYSNYAGVDVPYPNSSPITKITIDNPCNAGCMCSTSDYSPIQSANGITYFSPCYAGCAAQDPSQGFINCTCSSTNASSITNITSSVLVDGVYQATCSRKYLIIFASASFFVFAFAISNAVPSKIVTLRSVPDNHRAYGLGIQFVFMRTLGALPGPVIIGTIIDHACTLWKTRCGDPANCLNYDYYKLGWVITVYGFPPQALSLLFYYFSYKFSNETDTDGVSQGGAVEVSMERNNNKDSGGNKQAGGASGIANGIVNPCLELGIADTEDSVMTKL